MLQKLIRIVSLLRFKSVPTNYHSPVKSWHFQQPNKVERSIRTEQSGRYIDGNEKNKKIGVESFNGNSKYVCTCIYRYRKTQKLNSHFTLLFHTRKSQENVNILTGTVMCAFSTIQTWIFIYGALLKYTQPEFQARFPELLPGLLRVGRPSSGSMFSPGQKLHNSGIIFVKYWRHGTPGKSPTVFGVCLFRFLHWKFHRYAVYSKLHSASEGSYLFSSLILFGEFIALVTVL